MTTNEIIIAVQAAPDVQSVRLYESCGCCGRTRPIGMEIRSASVGHKVTYHTLYQHPKEDCENPAYEAGAGGAEPVVEAL